MPEAGEGTGLGLSVVHGIVTAHGGGINANSEPSLGTTIQFYLPCTAGATDETSEHELDIPMGTEKILFVDDDLPNTLIAKQLLSRLAHSVATRTGSVEAYDTLRAHPDEFDLIITDQTMPQMAEQERLNEVHNIRLEFPVNLVTGFSGYLVKPLVLKNMVKAVRKTLHVGSMIWGGGSAVRPD